MPVECFAQTRIVKLFDKKAVMQVNAGQPETINSFDF